MQDWLTGLTMCAAGFLICGVAPVWLLAQTGMGPEYTVWMFTFPASLGLLGTLWWGWRDRDALKRELRVRLKREQLRRQEFSERESPQ